MPFQQVDSPKTRPHNQLAMNVTANKPIVTEGNVTVRGSSKNRQQWGGFGSAWKYDNLLTFFPVVSGNTCFVPGGKWRIRGVGAWPVADTTLPLTESVAFVYVRKSNTSAGVEIGASPTDPDDADGDWHYQTLCKCVAVRSMYVITGRMYAGGDIVESAPLPGAP
jgi:hypothetical protein